MPNTTVPAAATGLPQETLTPGWYLLRQPNGADRLLWLEPRDDLWTTAVSPTLARSGQFFALLCDAALRAAAPNPLETGQHAASLSAWEASAIRL